MTGAGAATTLVFRLPKSAYIAAMILLFCAIPLAFADSGGDQAGPVGITWRAIVLALPVIAAVFIWRTATFVSASGIRVRAVFGSRTIAWGEIRGLSITGRSVYAVCADGSVRLPCVRVGDLAAVSRVSEGRLPEIAEPRRKYAPSRRPRR